MVGKAETEYERPITERGTDWRLAAKLKTDTAPGPRVLAIAVITLTTIWFNERPRVLGKESFRDSITSPETLGKRGAIEKPREKTVGNCIARCIKAPRTTPQTMPYKPNFGIKNKMPIIIPKL